MSTFLYRYQPLRSELNFRALHELIIEKKIWLSSFPSFNDPYECLPKFHPDLSPKDILRRYKHLKQQPISALSGVDLETSLKIKDIPLQKFRKQLSTKYVTDDLFPKMKAAAIELFNNTGITCFSEEGNNPAMWAYYADDHNGLVIEFECTDDGRVVSDLRGVIEKVVYKEERPIVLFSELVSLPSTRSLSWDTIKKFLSTKATVWSHERERRLLVPGKPNQHTKLGSIRISRLILGARCSPENEQKVQSIAASTSLSIVRATLHEHSFRMNIEGITP